MLLTFWSAKGGVGCTTVAVGVALRAADRSDVLLVDLGGDVLHVLGSPSAALGVTDWLASDVSAESLGRLEVAPGPDGLTVLPFGNARRFSAARVDSLRQALRDDARRVIVDAGQLVADHSPLSGCRHALVTSAPASVLVTRPCYLALRAAAALEVDPTEVVVVSEPGRSLSPRDVGDALSAPVAALVDTDPSVARAVDAGVLAQRLPRAFARQLRVLS